MNERKICYAGATSETLGDGLPEAILNGTAKIKRKAGDPQTVEKFRLILGFLMVLGGLYFGLFTDGAGEGLGFLSLMASPFVMVIDRN